MDVVHPAVEIRVCPKCMAPVGTPCSGTRGPPWAHVERVHPPEVEPSVKFVYRLGDFGPPYSGIRVEVQGTRAVAKWDAWLATQKVGKLLGIPNHAWNARHEVGDDGGTRYVYETCRPERFFEREASAARRKG